MISIIPRLTMVVAVAVLLGGHGCRPTGGQPRPGMPAEPQAQHPTGPVTIETFVRRVYVGGVPYDEVSRYDPSSVTPVLLAMLSDEKEESHWTNIVVTLGMLGDERAVEPLLAFLRSGDGKTLSADRYRAKTSVVMSLGYIVNKSGDDRALKFLVDGVSVNVWKHRGIGWKSPYHRSRQALYGQLASMSLLGLGLSGRPEAADVLVSVKRRLTTSDGKALRAQIPGVAGIVEESLKANAIIAKSGLDGYYAGETNPIP